MKNISQLISTINNVHSELQASAANAVNKALTVRNWLIGYYIVEYEQNGEDRAEYGSNLINILAAKISIKGLTSPELSRCRQFYQTYFYFFRTVSQDLENTSQIKILGTLSQKFIETHSTDVSIRGAVTRELTVPPKVLLSKLSYSHLIE